MKHRFGDSGLKACIKEGVVRGLCGGATGEAISAWTDQLSRYAGLLYVWSGRISLVSSGDRPNLAAKHILPAVALRALVVDVPHRWVWDVGTGAGLPGIPLAITLPEAQFLLIESRRKRVSFLREVVRQLSLANAVVVHGRLCEGFELARNFAPADIVLSRSAMGATQLRDAASGGLRPTGVILTTLSPDEKPPADSVKVHSWCVGDERGTAVIRPGNVEY